jgi:dTDP-4-dehydrorhamnose reductase
MLATENRASLCGLYHAAGSATATWYQFAQAVMEFSAAKGGASCAVRPIATSEYPTRARRPRNSRLDSSKLAEVFGVRLPTWQSSLDRCLDQLLPSRGAEP